jgi:hypothetical protein
MKKTTIGLLTTGFLAIGIIGSYSAGQASGTEPVKVVSGVDVSGSQFHVKNQAVEQFLNNVKVGKSL